MSTEVFLDKEIKSLIVSLMTIWDLTQNEISGQSLSKITFIHFCRVFKFSGGALRNDL